MHHVGPRLSGAALVSTLAVAAGATLVALLTFFAEPPPPPPPPVPQPADPRDALLLPPTDDGPPGSCQLTVLVEGAEGDAVAPRLELALVGAERTEATWSARPDGRAYRFTGLPRGTYHLSVFADGREAAAPPGFTCERDAARAFLAVPLRPATARALGRVTGRDAQAAPGTELLIERLSGPRGASGVLHAPVDAEGRFDVALAPGRYRLLALAPHHTPQAQEITVSRAGATALRIALPWRPEARGVVTGADGRPVPGAHVFAGPLVNPRVPPNVVVADEQGRFILPLVAGAPVVLTAHGPGGLASSSFGPVREVSGLSDVQLQLQAGRAVEGWVQRRDGRAHGFGAVRYRVRSLGLVGQVTADAEGHFVVPDMPRDADVELWAEGSAVGAWGAQVATPEKSRVLLTYVPPAY